MTSRGTTEVHDGSPLIALLRRPQLTYDDLRDFDAGCRAFPPALAESVEIAVKYEGYIRRQMAEVAEFARLEHRAIPEDIDYAKIDGLRLEAREKLAAIRPQNLGQAGRISGVSPADVAALMLYITSKTRTESRVFEYLEKAAKPPFSRGFAALRALPPVRRLRHAAPRREVICHAHVATNYRLKLFAPCAVQNLRC